MTTHRRAYRVANRPYVFFMFSVTLGIAAIALLFLDQAALGYRVVARRIQTGVVNPPKSGGKKRRRVNPVAEYTQGVLWERDGDK